MNKTDLSGIKLLVLDVDGVMTDGKIYMSNSGDEFKSFSVRDGSGMKYWQRAGGKLAIISGRPSEAVKRRAAELGVDAVRLHVKDKLPALMEILDEFGLSADQAGVIGDDLMDIPLARVCGFATAVGDAVDELKEIADYVTQSKGGDGCVREVVEYILKATGKWTQIMERYIPCINHDDEESAR